MGNSLKDGFILKGDLCFGRSKDVLETVENGYLLCLGGKSGGVFSRLPEAGAGLPLVDYSGKLVIPGLVDLHMHAPQYAFRGLGMDRELLDWLNSRAFPEEGKYADRAYAGQSYRRLVEDLVRGPNTRVCLFATIHTEATLLLMDLLEASGLVCLAGKVNMDRNCPEGLREESAEKAAGETRRWLEGCGGYRNVRPVLTPRFVPACSDRLMEALGKLREEFGLPLQSHLSENRREIEWVKELHPRSSCYGGVYESFGLFGQGPTVMAHCVHSGEEETALLASRGVWVAHCPQSNTNLSSGIAPVRRFLDRGLRVGLGSDVAGGVHSSIFRAMADAIGVSKLRRALLGNDEAPLTLEEAFWLGTAGGGSFFAAAWAGDAGTAAVRDGKAAGNGTAALTAAAGNAAVQAGNAAAAADTGDTAADAAGNGGPGSFEAGHDLDALIIDDAELAAPFDLSIRDRLERVVYLSENRHIIGKYVRGLRVR
jgi:guanine deaminase